MAKWIWKADTPPRVPAGARISAGKFGSVARSLPSAAVASVKRQPVNCIPSPGIAREADDRAFELLDSLTHTILEFAPRPDSFNSRPAR